MTSRTIVLTNDLLSELLKRERPDNAKLHAEDAITASVIRAGFITPPVVNDADGLLLEGHGRTDVLKRLHDAGDEPPPGIHLAEDGDWLVPTVHGARLGPADARAFVVAANRTVELGGWDEKRLAQVLLDLAADESGLSGVGYDAQDLDRIVSGPMKQVDRQAVHPDDVPDLGAKDVSVRLGETYQLGPDKVVCGDCRDPEVLATALAGRSAAALITDPLYGVDYLGKTSSHLKIAGDKAAGLSDLLSTAFASINAVLEPGAYPSTSSTLRVPCPSRSAVPSVMPAGTSDSLLSGTRALRFSGALTTSTRMNRLSTPPSRSWLAKAVRHGTVAVTRPPCWTSPGLGLRRTTRP